MLVTKRKGMWHMSFFYTHIPTGEQKRFRKSTGLPALKKHQPQALRMASEMRNVLCHTPTPNSLPSTQEEPQDQDGLFSKVASAYVDTLKAKGLKRSTLKSYDSILRIHLLPAFGNTPVSEITTKKVDTWFSTLIGANQKPLSKKTRNNIINFLSEIFAKAVVWEHCKENPIKPISRSKNEEKQMLFWSLEERDAFLVTANQSQQPHIFPLFATFLFTGMRVGEVLALQWEDVDLIHHTIHIQRNFVVDRVTTPKSGKSRYVQICSFLVGVLQQYQSTTQKSTGLVFSRKDGSHLSNEMLRKPFEKICKKAHIKKIRMHDMRHTFASLALMEGVDVPTVQKWLGHKDIQTTMRYIKLLPEHLQEQSKKLNPNAELIRICKGGSERESHPKSHTLNQNPTTNDH